MPKRADEVEQLCKILNLSDEALAIAEGWSILPAGMQMHVQLLINEYIAREVPALKKLYGNASARDQLRFDRIIEAAQDRVRQRPPKTN